MFENWSTIKKLIWLKYTVIAAKVKEILYTLSGTPPLLLQFAVKKGLKSLTQYGVTTQSGTPTPSEPKDIVCNNGVLKYGPTGNNLANMIASNLVIQQYINASGEEVADNNNFFYKAYIPVKPNTQYTLSLSSNVYFVSISEYTADKTFVERKSNSPDVNYITITTGADTHFIRFGSNMDRGRMTLEKVLGVNWMLNEGGAMPYEPYAEGIYVDNPETLTLGGKNLFYNSEEWDAGLFVTGGKVASAGQNRTFVMRCSPNTTYYWKHCNLVGGCRAFTVDADTVEVGVEGAWIKQNPVIGEVNEVYSATTGENAKWLCVCYGRNQNGAAPIADQWSDFILSVLPIDTDTPYEAYHTPQTATAENLFAVGDSQDEQEIISGVITRKVGIKIFDGTEGFTMSGVTFRTKDLSDKLENTKVLCTHFNGDVTPSSAVSAMPDLSVKGYGPSEDIFFKYSEITTVADFKAWLAEQYAAGTPVIVLYPLAEEVTEQATPQTLTTQEGNNVLSIVSDVLPNITVEYYGVESVAKADSAVVDESKAG